MTEQEFLHEAVIADLHERLQRVISAPANEYGLGELQGRLIAFALAKVISKDEFDGFHDRLEAAGFESIRIRSKLDSSPQVDGGKLLEKRVTQI